MQSAHNYKRMVVQQYIKDMTGKDVLIIFNQPDQIQRHLFMLEHCYSIAKKYYDKNKTTNKD